MRSLHVLVSEDVPEDIFIYQQAFRRVGISSYRFVTTGQEVIDYLQAKGPMRMSNALTNWAPTPISSNQPGSNR